MLTRPGNPIPRPVPTHELDCDTSKPYHSDHVCYPADHDAEWSIFQVFGKVMKGTCPLADPNVPPVCLQIPNSQSVYTTGDAQEKKNPDGKTRCFEIGPDADFELVVPVAQKNPDTPDIVVEGLVKTETPLLYAERSFTGHGQERGGVQTILRNPSLDTEVEFIYMETLPWFMRIYLHTVEARIEGESSKSDSLIQETYYRPAVDRARGTQLELRMRVPPASTVFLTYDFEKSILRYTEYPPDANRGFDVAAAVITILNPDKNGTNFAVHNLRTTSLLCSLPTPDFSMPYNVIIFTSTAIALAFGGLFNILVRRFVAADEGPEVGAGLKARLRAKIGRLAERFSKRKAEVQKGAEEKKKG